VPSEEFGAPSPSDLLGAFGPAEARREWRPTWLVSSTGCHSPALVKKGSRERAQLLSLSFPRSPVCASIRVVSSNRSGERVAARLKIDRHVLLWQSKRGPRLPESQNLPTLGSQAVSVSRSRRTLVSIFSRHQAAFAFGQVACLGHPCQKQPSTKTRTLRLS